MQMQQLVVRIPSQQKNIFEQIAQQKDESVSNLVREALDIYLRKQMKSRSSNLLLELADIGKKIKGPKNLSNSYKKVLYKK